MFSTHPGSDSFYNYARRIEGSKGNTPGNPYDYQHLDPCGGRINTTPEYLDVRPEHANAIPQARFETSVAEVGYSSMVPDLPFDVKAQQEKEDLWKMMGFGFLLVGIIYFSRRYRG